MNAKRLALLLEDEPIIAFALEDMLIALGYEVQFATTISEARAYLDQANPHVAILDVNIQGDRSYGVAEILLARAIPFVFATGYGDAEHPGTLKTVTTLTKPYSLNDLERALAATSDKELPCQGSRAGMTDE